MKKLLMAAVAVSALAVTPAFATAPSYTVQGTVTATCSALTTSTLDFGTNGLVDASGNVNTAAPAQTATDTSAYCNGVATTLDVAHVALTTSGTAPTGFIKTIDFTPEVKTGTGTGTATTQTGNTTSAVTVGAFTGISVAAKSLSGSGKPIAGSYSGSITVTLTPTA